MKQLGHSEIKKHVLSERPILETIFLCIIASVLNFLLDFTTARIIKIPLFLDTIFSITILFYCGLIPSICCAILSCIPTIIINKTFFYLLFSLCSIVFLLITNLIKNISNLSKKNNGLIILYLLFAALLSAILGSIIGGILHFFCYIKYPDIEKLKITELFIFSIFSQNQNLIITAILGRLPNTCIDRIISIFAGYGIYKLIDKKLGIRYKNKKSL